MVSKEQVVDFFKNGHKNYIPGISIECVIFGYHFQELKVLLGRTVLYDGWQFPSAYVKREERLSDAAARILWERTSLENIFLQQFHVFGDNNERSKDRAELPHEPSIAHESYSELIKISRDLVGDSWLAKRTISIGYYALIDYQLAEVRADYPFDEFSWFSINAIPELVFDHREILDKALSTLREQIHLKPIGLNLLPDKFTLPDIHILYETILNKKLDRRNFPKKLLSLGVLEKLNEKRKIGQHRSPFLYQFNQEKYREALNDGGIRVF